MEILTLKDFINLQIMVILNQPNHTGVSSSRLGGRCQQSTSKIKNSTMVLLTSYLLDTKICLGYYKVKEFSY